MKVENDGWENEQQRTCAHEFRYQGDVYLDCNYTMRYAQYYCIRCLTTREVPFDGVRCTERH